MDGNFLPCLFPFKEISRLKQLQHLDMSLNSFSGPVSFADCEGLAYLKNLEILILDENYMDNTSLQCVSTISSLKYLSMADNSMQGLFPFKEINRLTQLQHLDMSYNNFSGPISFTALKLENLELLKLGEISFADNAVEFSSIDVMTSLKALYLDGNDIKNSSIIQEICSLKNLVELGLSQNSFGGNVPLCFSNLTSLEFLDVSYNNFSGTIPKFASLKFLDISHNNFSGTIPSLAIASLVHLESLYLQSNHFEGSFSFGSFVDHSKLQVFVLLDQDKEIYVNFDGLPLPPPFQLRVLYLVQCNLNNETRQIPDFLLSQTELRELDLSSNNFVGEFPNWLLENNSHLVVFRLRNNSFTGSFLGNGTVTMALQDLLLLDISNNEVSGQVPQDVDLLFPHLEYFNLSKNSLQGIIPESIGNWKMVNVIDLSHNNFSGEVPDRIGTGCVRLEVLILSNNNLRGHFPSSSMNLTNLLCLRLDINHFIGNISDGLSHSSYLEILDISNNGLEGKIPSWIANFSSLRTLDLSGNKLEGTIPDDMCKLDFLQFIDLSLNSLNGSILSCSTLLALRFLHLRWNQFTGSIPNKFLNGSKDLITLDLSYNDLSGRIPHDITVFTQLQVFLLGGNNLQGHIPVDICQLKNLNIMDLSHNHFSGRIPTCLNGISFGRGNYTSNVFKDWDAIDIFVADAYTMDDFEFPIDELFVTHQEEVAFRTKSIIRSYTGNILNYMSGLDLSGNRLTGEIPQELCDLSHLRSLNLSHNYFQGSIPSRLSVLNLIESLDLSYNNLSGQIPYELVNLHFLSLFNVSYNNLSGRTPDQGQFANFDENNYRGNLGLCGPQLQRHCGTSRGTVDPGQVVGDEYQNDGGIDMQAFFWGFFGSMGAALTTLALFLYLSPEYRRVWFGLIDAWILFRFYRWYRSQFK